MDYLRSILTWVLRQMKCLPDSAYLFLLFYLRMGEVLHMKHPRTFSEKLQWLKLHDHQPDYIEMVDKVEAKKYIAGIIGDKYVIPTIAVYNSVDEIDFDVLPNQFVLKCTHDSGGLVICTDKTNLDKEAVRKRLKKYLNKNYYWRGREWPYKFVKPRIIAEKYIFKEGEELKDYKFMCYNGICKNLFVCSGRAKKDLRVDFFDTGWNHLPFKRKYPNAEVEIPKPDHLHEMIDLSETIAKNIGSLFVRVDFYDLSGNVYFGELTFYPGSGMERFCPKEWDLKLGEMLQLQQ